MGDSCADGKARDGSCRAWAPSALQLRSSRDGNWAMESCEAFSRKEEVTELFPEDTATEEMWLMLLELVCS